MSGVHMNNIVGGYIITNEPFATSVISVTFTTHNDPTISKSQQKQSRTAPSQMNCFNFILVLVCFTTVSLQNGTEFSHLQSDLLNLLEIKEKPSVSRSRSQVPKYVMDLYKEQAHSSGFTKASKSAPTKTIRTFFRGM